MAHASNHDLDERKPRRISGLADIIINVASLTIPMLIFCAILLGLVFHNRIQQQDLPSGTLGNFDVEDGWYYVQYSATRLVFVASLASTAAPIVGMCIVPLWSFSVASSIATSTEEKASLPTPFQLSLMLRMLSGGGFGPLWHWLKYLWTWRTTRLPHSRALLSIGSATAIAVLLGLLVTLTDIWLHVSTKTVPFTQTILLSDGGLPRYTYRLPAYCANNVAPNTPDGCDSIGRASSGNYLLNAPRCIETLNNVSPSVMVATRNDSVGSSYAYLAVSSSQEISNVDFSAETYGVKTKCSPISRQCNLTSHGIGVSYQCNDVFKGDLSTQGKFDLWPFTDSSMTSNDTDATSYKNPFYTGIAANTLNLLTAAYDTIPPLLEDPDIVVPLHGGLTFVLGCQTTAYDISYDWVNGSIARFEARVSNDTLARLAQETIKQGWKTYFAGFYQTQTLLNGRSNSTQEIADKMASDHSRVVLSAFMNALMPDKVGQAQTRSFFLVAKVSVAALWCLILANLLFVIAGAVLLVLALYARSKDGAVDELQARLSIAGLVADRFESTRREQPVRQVEELYEEYHNGVASVRISIGLNRRGGFVYEEI